MEAIVLLTRISQVFCPLCQRIARKSSSGDFPMANFNTPNGGAAESRSSGQFLRLRQSRTLTSISISQVDPPLSSANHASNNRTRSNDEPLSPLAIILSCFHLVRRSVKGQSTATTNPARTYAGTAEPSPLESETRLWCSLQQTSRHPNAETARHNLVWFRNQLASPDTRTGAYSSDDDDDDDDAKSDYSELVPENESDAKAAQQCVTLVAYDSDLDQLVFFCGTCDTGADLNIISYAKARLVAPDDISNGFSSVGKRTVDVLGGSVTVHGPIWVTFCLRNTSSHRTRYRAAFYVLPERYGESYFDALLNTELAERLQLVEIRRHSTLEVEARR
jgi:hypothetical protein